MRKLTADAMKPGTKFLLFEDNIVFSIEEIDDWQVYASWILTEQDVKYTKRDVWHVEVLEQLAYLVDFDE